MAAPAAVEQGCLEDDVGAGAHRGQRLGLRRPQAGGAVRLPVGHLPDAAASGGQDLDVALLVVVAAPPDEVQLGIIPNGLLDLAARAGLLERDQVIALEKPDQIGCRDDEGAVLVELHWHASYG